ncbi:hypothetical protein HQ545_08090, partial [Candidatus Woesearchaeota archaeon]|nr:hypothetical protein [Candidatus Woesearchaeota archaeon]
MMLNIDIANLNIKNYSSLKKKLSDIMGMETPSFEEHKEDIELLKAIITNHRRFNNLILIGNGGSNTSFKAFHQALVPLNNKKKAFILTTMEPDLIKDLKDTFPKRKTLIMPVSKSGNTVGTLESMFAFNDFKTLAVTGGGALDAISKKLSIDTINHPDVGGRFSAFTSCAYAPSLFFGIDVDGVEKGARSMYEKCRPSISIDQNPALQIAASLFLLDKKGYKEIFCPIYSSRLSGFQNLIMQLMHETVGKEGKGQTMICADAPD